MVLGPDEVHRPRSAEEIDAVQRSSGSAANCSARDEQAAGRRFEVQTPFGMSCSAV